MGEMKNRLMDEEESLSNIYDSCLPEMKSRYEDVTNAKLAALRLATVIYVNNKIAETRRQRNDSDNDKSNDRKED